MKCTFNSFFRISWFRHTCQPFRQPFWKCCLGDTNGCVSIQGLRSSEDAVFSGGGGLCGLRRPNWRKMVCSTEDLHHQPVPPWLLSLSNRAAVGHIKTVWMPLELKHDTQALDISSLLPLWKTVCQWSAMNPGIGWCFKNQPVGAFASRGWKDAFEGASAMGQSHRRDTLGFQKDAAPELRHSLCHSVTSWIQFGEKSWIGIFPEHLKVLWHLCHHGLLWIKGRVQHFRKYAFSILYWELDMYMIALWVQKRL